MTRGRLGRSVLVAASISVACYGSGGNELRVADAGTNALDDAGEGAADALDVSADAFAALDLGGDGGQILSIEVSPPGLTPAFDPSVTDYVVPCGTGGSRVTLTVTTVATSVSVREAWTEGQLVSVGGYWIRCLPHDFPAITVSRPGTPTPGYYLVNSRTYGMVLDGNGVPVWYAAGSLVVNVDSALPNTLSLMPDVTDGPFGVTPSSAFDVWSLGSGAIATVRAQKGATDGHELRTLPNGDYLLFTVPFETDVDLTGLEGFGTDETVAGCEIQELSPTGVLVWSWLASDHVDPVRETIAPLTETILGMQVADVYHCNSIDVGNSDDLLVSLRQANAVYDIDRVTGKVLWKLGGTAVSKDDAPCLRIQADPETAFTLQHDARFQAGGDVSVFDDHGSGSGVARGVQYALDHTKNVATVSFEYRGTAASGYQGSFRRYADGESVVGWGYIASDPRVLTEIDAQGHDVFDVAMGGEVSYRAVKVPPSQLDLALLRKTAGH